MNETVNSRKQGRRFSAVRWAVLGLISTLIWLIIGPLMIRSELRVKSNGAKPGPVLSWTHSGDDVRSGMYGIMVGDAEDQLTFEVTALDPDAAEPYEFWLYYVRAESPEKYDLSSLVDRGANPGWNPFLEGDGVVYRGNAPTKLVLPHVRGDVVVGYGRTVSSGTVHVLRGDTKIDLKCRTSQQDSKILVIPESAVRASSGEYRWNLPNSKVEDLRLEFETEPNARLSVAEATCVKSFGPFEALRIKVPLQPAGGLIAGDSESWTSPDGRACFVPVMTAGGSWVLHVAGFGIVSVFVGICPRFIRATRNGMSAILKSPVALEGCVALFLIGVHGAIASTIPVSVSGDGIDYLNGADGLASNFDWARLPDYKVPGLSFILAGFMKVTSDAISAFGWLNAGLSCLNAALCYAIVRSRAGRGWAIVTALAVGLHPSLITYQTWLLRELPSAFIMALIAAVLVFLPLNKSRTWKSNMIWGIGLGLIGALGAYLRENFIILIVLIPLAVVVSLSDSWRARCVVAVAALLTSVAAVYPRASVIHSAYGKWSMVSPKLAWNQLLASWQNRDFKGNDIRIFGFEEWNEFLRLAGQASISDYDFATKALDGFRVRVGIAAQSSREIDDIAARIMKDARDTNSARYAESAWLSFVNQIGLWNVQAGSRRIQSASSEYYSTALRGRRSGSPDNFAVDARAALQSPQTLPFRSRMEELVRNSRRSVRFLEESSFGAFFHEWFYGFRAIRPFVGALFIAGTFIAWKRRDAPLFMIHAMVITFALATAFGTGALADRFAAPFIPVMWCGASIALQRIITQAKAIAVS